MTMDKRLKELYHQAQGAHATQCDRLAGAGSNRAYYRLASDKAGTAIGVVGTTTRENEAFLGLTHHFGAQGLPVPQVLAVSDDRLCYLVSDLGDTALYDALTSARQRGTYNTEELELLGQTIDLLPRLQFQGAAEIDWSLCYPQPTFDRRTVMWDLNYFKYSFLKLAQIEFDEPLLEDEFERMADRLCDTEWTSFMYRDFQARNVMVHEGSPHFIDYQGGRRGPYLYDLASFVWQARAAYPSEIRTMLIERYRQALKPYVRLTSDELTTQLREWRLFRLLQVIGAYGYRGLYERKSAFLLSLPQAATQLREWLAEGDTGYTYLDTLLRQIASDPRYAEPVMRTGLTVKVYSFSYHRGIPTDDSGNGGGFVFDCRALDNPGRYPEYRHVTGLDHPVIEFFDRHLSIHDFIAEVQPLVGRSVLTYKQRGFAHLQLSFGCTGGQHRSVFAAQHIGEWIANTYDVRVEIIHREQQITQTIEPRL